MVLIRTLLVIISIFFIYSCNSGKTEEEMEELWSKAQTTGKIIERSGTKFNSGSNKKLALQDAETRLQTGGGLLGKGGIKVDGILGNNEKKGASVSTFGMPINIYLWRGALDTISFMPLNSADPIGGTILTDWYSSANNLDERCKLNIFITGSELKTQNLRVTSFCQLFKNQKWENNNVDSDNNIKIENAILNKAKKLKLQSS
tara:strand:+ start:446 stop:1054 length:609 start_codon:yes stop_codon:yes gene_type:complete